MCHNRKTYIQMNEWSFTPLLFTYRLNWAMRTSRGWWYESDDTALQTQDSKFQPWLSDAEQATSRSRRLSTILIIFTSEWGRNISFFEIDACSVLTDVICGNPANTRRWPNVGSMLTHRLRRRANIEPTFGKRLVFAGKPEMTRCQWLFSEFWYLVKVSLQWAVYHMHHRPTNSLEHCICADQQEVMEMLVALLLFLLWFPSRYYMCWPYSYWIRTLHCFTKKDMWSGNCIHTSAIWIIYTALQIKMAISAYL